MRTRLLRMGAVTRFGFPLAALLAAGCSAGVRDSEGAGDTPRHTPLDLFTDVDGGTTGVTDGDVPSDASLPPEDGGTADGGAPSPPSGYWHFDDCSTASSFLLDSSGHGASARHVKNRTCAAGVHGLGVAVHHYGDRLEVADEPQFTIDGRLAVAAWVRPEDVSGHHPIIVKKGAGTVAFSLAIQSGEVQMAVSLTDGRTIASSAPIDVNVWSHVAGVYDGHALSLFLNGQLVGLVTEPGVVKNVQGPILIGATSPSHFFDGVVDELWLSTLPVATRDVAALSCIADPPSVTVSPQASGAVPFDTPVHYAITVSNNDIGACAPRSFFLSLPSSGNGPTPVPVAGGPVAVGGPAGSVDGGTPPFPPNDPDAGPPPSPPPPSTTDDGLRVEANPQSSPQLSPGTRFTFDVTVSGSDEADPGVHDVPFTLFDFSGGAQPLAGSMRFDLLSPTGCHVTTGHEVLVRDTSVVDDPVRTGFSAPGGDPRRGAWTFARLMRDMAPTPAVAPAFAERLFRTWLTDQTLNGFVMAARPSMQQMVLDAWPRAADGSLDLERAPLRLLAIVNRIDLRDLSRGNAGEGRFVFGVVGPNGEAEEFTVIFEFGLPARTEADVVAWANAWHALGSQPFPSEAYNVALEAITRRFSGRGVEPGRPNGSALHQIRTNEFALSPRWELRQFALSATTGLLEPQAVALTPDLTFNGSDKLARFINDNEDAILAERHTVPVELEGAPFATGAVFNDLIAWTAPGIRNNEARFRLSLNTCNGCHGAAETNTAFLQISNRSAGQRALLSPFLQGTTVRDPVTGALRTLSDLGRRKADLTALVCPTAPPPSAKPNALMPLVPPTVAKGISRVH